MKCFGILLGATALAVFIACGADAGGGFSFGHGYSTHHSYSQPTYYNQALILPVAVSPPYNPYYYTVQDYYGQALLADAIAARSAALTQKSPASATPCEHLKGQLEQLTKRMESLEKPAASAPTAMNDSPPQQPEKLTVAPSGSDAIKQSCAQCHSGKVAKGGFAIEQLTTPAAIGGAMSAILEGRMPKRCPTCVPLTPKTTGEALLFLSTQLSKVK